MAENSTSPLLSLRVREWLPAAGGAAARACARGICVADDLQRQRAEAGRHAHFNE
jgi:hypothetical protein